MKKILYLSLLLLLTGNLYGTEFKGTFYQGNLIIGETTPGAKVIIDGRKIKLSKKGFFVFGLTKDRKNNVDIEIIYNGVSKKIIKKVYKKKYKIQKINGLPQKFVTPPKEVYDRIKSDNKLIGKARSIDSDLIFFTQSFKIPVKDPVITGVYGSQRILNGIPRSPHYGLDFAAKEGVEVKAMLDGIVTLAESDMYYTGGTIIFDHGHGVGTLFMHMKNVYVKKGQKIKQGDVVGTVGKTGRATGAHLDIRLNWFDVKLDPSSVLQDK